MRTLAKFTVSFIACLLLLCAPLVQAKVDVVLLLSSDSEPYQDVAGGIRETLLEKYQPHSLQTLMLDSLLSNEQQMPDKHTVLVTIGTRATRYALQEKISDTIYASFITASGLLREIATDEGFPKALKGAVVLDQPALRIVQLAKLINPKARNLGTVVNGSAPNRLDEFTRVVKAQGLRLKAATLIEESNPITDLKRIFSNSDVFLVIPDKSRFNSKIAKWVLFLSYRHRVPVVGYSQKYTDAGALVSIFSTPQQVGRDTGERLVEKLNGKNSSTGIVRLQYPRYFSLSINEKVANSLGIKIDTPAQLKERMRIKYGVTIKDDSGLLMEVVEE